MIFTDDELKSFHALTEELNEELANDVTEEDKEKLASYIKLMEEKGAMTQRLRSERVALCHADIADSCPQHRFEARFGTCHRAVCRL